VNPPYFIEPQAHFGLLTYNINDYKSRTLLGAYRNRNNYMSGKRRLSLIEYAVFQNDPTLEINETSITSVQYPNIVFAPIYSPGGFFRYDAFWSLYLPKYVKSYNERYLLRSLWSQRLMRLLDGRVKFHRLEVNKDFHELDTHHSTNKVNKTMDISQVKVKKLSGFLNDLECKDANLYECVIGLSKTMSDGGCWSHNEVK
jgi:transposase